MIGYLTTPTSSIGVSLSEFWAWIRYLAAISGEGDITLTRSFFELDAHQKTILSDDFGMGIPMLWLSDKLSLTEIVDGRYFMQKISASVGATQKRTAKRGPNKTPDFVARDTRGKWHVIECKGTQSGAEFSNKQIGKGGALPTGGVAQKLSIRFPANYTGQRLACGLSIGVEGGGRSLLKIVDPEPDDPFEFASDQLVLADDAAFRGVMSRALRMAGFEITAGAVASPLGAAPSSKRELSQKEELRRWIDERDVRSKKEISDTDRHAQMFDKKFRGREIEIPLPREVLVDSRPVGKVIIRQGINEEALASLLEQPTYEELVDEQQTPWINLMGKSIVSADGPTATMRIGDVFQSEIVFEGKDKSPVNRRRISRTRS